MADAGVPVLGQATPVPEVRPTHAGKADPHYRIGGLLDAGVWSVFDANVAWSPVDGSLHSDHRTMYTGAAKPQLSPVAQVFPYRGQTPAILANVQEDRRERELSGAVIVTTTEPPATSALPIYYPVNPCASRSQRAGGRAASRARC